MSMTKGAKAKARRVTKEEKEKEDGGTMLGHLAEDVVKMVVVERDRKDVVKARKVVRAKEIPKGRKVVRKEARCELVRINVQSASSTAIGAVSVPTRW